MSKLFNIRQQTFFSTDFTLVSTRSILHSKGQKMFLVPRLSMVARYSFSGPIPPKFEHKLRRHKQIFGKIVTTVVLDKDENLL